jgi:large subunit ribosomal protein L9
MQVILIENVSHLGFVGDLVQVKNGYARNYLIPHKKAVPASRSSIKHFEHQRRVIEIKKAHKKTEADALLGRLEGVVVRLTHAVGDGDRLYGSVAMTEVAEGLKSAGFAVDRKLIRSESPIKTLGEHEVEVKLHQDVVAKVKVIVEKKEG